MNCYQFLALLGAVAFACERAYWAGHDDCGRGDYTEPHEGVSDAFWALSQRAIRTGGLHR